ncbi:MAG: thiolase family protein [Ottowia sp.]|uniref:thiolase family protein n=1 Tax=Ottowia sp. TaxID=1898956 RepID=UPI003C757274
MTRARLTGVGHTQVGKLPGSSCMGLHDEAAHAAIADAGLKLRDIDGVLCAYSLAEPHPMLASYFCEYVGLQPAFNLAVQAGGATACIMIMQAAALVESGVCRHVLCVTGDTRATGMARDGGAVAALAGFGHPQFEQPHGMSVPAAYALVAQRYMHEYEATPEQLAAIAVEHRRHAARHPGAHMRDPLQIEDVMRSRLISSPLRLLDCCLVSDGGAAVVVSASDAARDTRAPVSLLGAGQGHTHEHIVAASSLVEFGCRQAADRAFGRAQVNRSDIDVALVYDSFTITLLIQLESIGFFEKGEAGRAALAGELGLNGRLPCNTHGGLLSFGHSGAAGGMFHIVEAVRQLRREADARQVSDAELAFVHGDGGILSAHCSLILGRC